ncbi:MAG: BsuPI-related putative proteinase inhibitor [bacterium]|nr:BsuPI-related putative proteinase inhibitor [bacterium]
MSRLRCMFLILLLFPVPRVMAQTGDSLITIDSHVIPLPAIDLADFFPMRSGITWEYIGSPFKSSRRLGLVEVATDLPAQTFKWEGFQGELTVRKTADGKIVTVTPSGESLFLDLAAEVGSSWRLSSDIDNLLGGSVVSVISRSEPVKVPFGLFQNVLHLGLKPNPQLADAGVTDMWFAPGIGLLRWTEITFAGPQTYELISLVDPDQNGTFEPGDSTGVIGPYPMPEPEPLRPMEDYENRTSVERNGVRYELGTLKPVAVRGASIEIQYRVTALEGETLFSFDSGQIYDFQLQNDRGESAWTWSANRSFIFAITTFSLKPGESRSFSEWLEGDTVTVPEGHYTLAAFMPTSKGSSPSLDQTSLAVALEIVPDPDLALLTGTVVNETGAPLPALISLTESGPSDSPYLGTASAAWTTPNGTFEIRARAGTYTLSVRSDGYVIYARSIALVAGDTHLDIALKQKEKDPYANVHEMVNGRFIAELATDQSTYGAGDRIGVRYRLTNISGEDLLLSFSSGQRFDLTLDGQRGRIWTWSEDKDFIQALDSRLLKDQETYEFETEFTLEQAWVKDDPSFLITAYLAVTQDDVGQVSRKETEALVKFPVDGWILPTPEPPGPLSASLRTDRDAYQAGDTVTVSYKLTNIADSLVVLHFNSGQRYDIVLNAPDEPIWGWSWTMGFTSEIGELALAPGESFAFEEQIDLKVLPETKDPIDGVYVIRAYMTSVGDLDSDATEAKTRFWMGKIPRPEPYPVPLPVEPIPSRLLANMDATLDETSAHVTYRIVNVTEETIPLLFRSGQTFDFILNGPRGEVWRWSTGRGFDDGLHAQTLAPGESVTVRESFPLSALSSMGDGVYSLQVYLTLTAEDRQSAHQVETLTSIQFSMDQGVIERTLTMHGDAGSAPDVSAKSGDFDGDGSTNFADFLNFAAAFGKTSLSTDFNPVFDLDHDNKIAFGDFLIFAAGFGR